MHKYFPEVPVWWPYAALALLAWWALDAAFGWPGEPAYSVTFAFAYALGASHGYRKERAR